MSGWSDPDVLKKMEEICRASGGTFAADLDGPGEYEKLIQALMPIRFTHTASKGSE